jgi:thiamine transport system ATP-binding protein
MLELRGICKAFDNPVLTDFDLDVGEGEIVALLGPSGSGKSTVLRIITGLETADAGSVTFQGRDLADIPPEGRGIGMVFQRLALFPHLDVAGNLRFGLARDGDESRIDEMLDLVGLDGFGGRRIETLSGGEAQRVALARSLIAEPRMLLLDEPLSSLDADLKESLADEVRRVLKTLGIPAIHVTHDGALAARLADRIVHLASARELAKE